MEHAGVRSGGDDGRVGKAARPLAEELVGQLGLDFKLMRAGFHKPAHAPEAVARDARGLAQGRYLGGVLLTAQAVHERGQAAQVVQRILPADAACEAGFARLHRAGGARVLVGV